MNLRKTLNEEDARENAGKQSTPEAANTLSQTELKKIRSSGIR